MKKYVSNLPFRRVSLIGCTQVSTHLPMLDEGCHFHQRQLINPFLSTMSRCVVGNFPVWHLRFYASLRLFQASRNVPLFCFLFTQQISCFTNSPIATANSIPKQSNVTCLAPIYNNSKIAYASLQVPSGIHSILRQTLLSSGNLYGPS